MSDSNFNNPFGTDTKEMDDWKDRRKNQFKYNIDVERMVDKASNGESDMQQGLKKSKEMTDFITKGAGQFVSMAAFNRAYKNLSNDKSAEAALQRMNNNLQAMGLDAIDTTPTVSTDEFVKTTTDVANKKGYKSIEFERNLNKNVQGNYAYGIKENGQKERIELNKINVSYKESGFSNPNYRAFSEAYMNPKYSMSETSRQNNEKVNKLIMANSKWKKQGFAEMNSHELNNFIKKLDKSGNWQETHFEPDDIAQLKIMARIKQTNELGQRYTRRTNAASKFYKEEAKKQVQDADVVQGYTSVKKGRDNIVNTLAMKDRIIDSYYNVKRFQYRADMNHYKKMAEKKGIDVETIRNYDNVSKRYESLFGEKGRSTLRDKRKAEKARKKENRSVKGQFRRAQNNLRGRKASRQIKKYKTSNGKNMVKIKQSITKAVITTIKSVFALIGKLFGGIFSAVCSALISISPILIIFLVIILTVTGISNAVGSAFRSILVPAVNQQIEDDEEDEDDDDDDNNNNNQNTNNPEADDGSDDGSDEDSDEDSDDDYDDSGEDEEASDEDW